MNRPFAALLAALLLFSRALSAQDADAGKADDKPKAPFSAETFSGIKLRSLGPAVTSGRVGDIAVVPSRPSTWYVAVASGGVFKTVNAGTTWTPVFDEQGSYSIGCVTVDPTNPNVVWAPARTTRSGASRTATASTSRSTAARAGRTSD